MKKLIVLLLVLLFTLCGCEFNDLSSSESNLTQNSSNLSGLDQISSVEDNSNANTENIDFVAQYNYGSFVVGELVTLYSSSILFFDLPEDVTEEISGDVYNIEYTGSMYILETYPSRVVLNGEIKNVKRTKAKILEMEVVNQSDKICFVYDGVEIEHPNSNLPEYYISKDENGKRIYLPIEDLPLNTTLFASIKSADAGKPIQDIDIYGLHDYNPYKNE